MNQLLLADARATPVSCQPPLIIDSFAGGGGASTGIEMALGISPHIAINHNPAALALHAANHPDTLHISQNIYKVDPLDYISGRHIGLAWFSPDCTHFSRAKGGTPVARNIRDLAHIIPFWIERIQKSGGKIDVVIMENVEEFVTWGPLVQTPLGLMPCPDRKGETFAKWKSRLRRLGGRIEMKKLSGHDYGAPTIRKRLFIIIRFDGQPIVWPEPTHARPDDPDVLAGRKKPWNVTADQLDWSIPCPSIFDSRDEIREKWNLRANRPLVFKTLARIARGIKKEILDNTTPVIVSIPATESRQEPEVITPAVTRFSSGSTGHAVNRPLATITANSFHKRPGGAAPIGIIAPQIRHHQSAAAAPIVAQHNSTRNGSPNPGRSVNDPLSTITTTGSQQALVSAFIARHFGTISSHPVTEPSHTVMPQGSGKSILVTPFLQSYYGTELDGDSVMAPMRTITAKSRHGLVRTTVRIPPFESHHASRAREVAKLMREHGYWDDREFVTFSVDGHTLVIVDIGIRMLTPRELFNAQGFPKSYEIETGLINGTRIELTKDVQISCVGNSVCPPVAEALVRENCRDIFDLRHSSSKAA